jgi:hypothetical protein
MHPLHPVVREGPTKNWNTSGTALPCVPKLNSSGAIRGHCQPSTSTVPWVFPVKTSGRALVCVATPGCQSTVWRVT